MLDMKHKNIGATVSMVKMIHEVVDDEKLPNELTNLFTLESEECDYKSLAKYCLFNRTEPNVNLEESMTKCCVVECPLGSMVGKELKDSPGLPILGACAHCGESVDMNNIGHMDDHMQVCKPCFDEKGI